MILLFQVLGQFPSAEEAAPLGGDGRQKEARGRRGQPKVPELFLLPRPVPAARPHREGSPRLCSKNRDPTEFPEISTVPLGEPGGKRRLRM